MTKIFIVLFIAFSFEAVGVVILKRGIDQISARFQERKASVSYAKNVLKLVGNWFANKNVLLGLLLETIFFIMLQYLLSQRDVSFIWPLTALSYVLTTIAAQFILHETVDVKRWAGVGLIILGAALITYSEHTKQKPDHDSSNRNETSNAFG
jgi:drug/metabolite transporter (DMT)-like permease